MHEDAEMENLDDVVTWDSAEKQIYVSLRLVPCEVIHFILLY